MREVRWWEGGNRSSPVVLERSRELAGEGRSEIERPEGAILVPVIETPVRPRLKERPLEEVELAAVPLPAPGLLLLGGLGALAMLGRRRIA